MKTIIFLFISLQCFGQQKTDSTWYGKMKYTPLSANGNTYLSFGGDVRYQYFLFKNEDWGAAPTDKDGFILTRYLGHADLHAGKHFRAFVQLQSSLANGKEKPPSPVDEDQLDIHQAFIDLKLKKFTLRMGRQEFSFGSQRLVSVREGSNNRQAFDAIDLQYGKSHLFFSHYVYAKQKIFDDKFDQHTKFWGIYAVFKHLDLYYLGLQKASTAFDDGTGKELRHSVGTRAFNKTPRWQYDVEAVYQWGKFGSSRISAWTASADIAYTVKALQFGLRTELISGDKKYNDGKLNTFNPLFPRGSYFGLAAIIGPSNLGDIHPSVTLAITKKISWQTDYDIFWRMSSNDGVYGPNVKVIYRGEDTHAKQIGRQLGTAFIYQLNKFLYFRLEGTWFEAGDYLKEAGPGKDILMGGTTIQVKF